MTRNDIEKLGGPKEVAKICEVGASAVTMWFTPEERGGKGGKIPYKRAKMILDHARKLGINWSIEYIVGE